jgi:uncharacterized protein (DUF58 family)
MTPELLARIRGIELAVVGRIEGLLQGDHRGLLPGPGGEAGDARPYVPGDDVRRIDWAVSARTQRPHVRDTTADHELETTIVVDTSGSMAFGSASTSKADVALGAAAVFGFLTDRAGDRVGAVVSGGEGNQVLPARSGRAHVYAILSKLGPVNSSAEGDLEGALRTAARVKRRRGLVVVVSDFLDEGWIRPFRSLAQRHDAVAVEVFDPREVELSDVGMVKMSDPETGAIAWIDTSNGSMRSAFEADARQRRQRISQEIRNAGATHIPVSTQGDWAAQLVTSVLSRRRVMAATGRGA